jgi:hypothetical protein
MMKSRTLGDFAGNETIFEWTAILELVSAISDEIIERER